MLNGRTKIPKLVDESHCRITEDYIMAEIADYKIHSTSIMPNIEFEESAKHQYKIDKSIFINNDDTELELDSFTYKQNYITTRYVGRAPLEYYGPPTEMGRQFILFCLNGETDYGNRFFGTEDAIRGFNRNANEPVLFPLED